MLVCFRSKNVVPLKCGMYALKITMDKVSNIRLHFEYGISTAFDLKYSWGKVEESLENQEAIQVFLL